MIRDPSDGSIKEAPKVDVSLPTSGLPVSKQKAEDAARLERSREWLKAYHEARK